NGLPGLGTHRHSLASTGVVGDRPSKYARSGAGATLFRGVAFGRAHPAGGHGLAAGLGALARATLRAGPVEDVEVADDVRQALAGGAGCEPHGDHAADRVDLGDSPRGEEPAGQLVDGPVVEDVVDRAVVLVPLAGERSVELEPGEAGVA